MATVVKKDGIYTDGKQVYKMAPVQIKPYDTIGDIRNLEKRVTGIEAMIRRQSKVSAWKRGGRRR